MSGYVVVMGDANVDMLIHLPDRSKKPLDLSRSFPQLSGGGTAGNTLAALARLEVPVVFAGAVGDDGFGRWIADDLRREGVDLRGLKMLPDAFTVQVIALIEPDGERLMVVFPHTGGAHTLLRVEDLDRELITGAAWLHTTGIGLRPGPMRETMLAAMQLARMAGIPVSLDLNLRLELWGWGGGFREALQTAIKFCNVLLGSGQEEILPAAGEISGKVTASIVSIEEAARALAADSRTVIARLGAEGALAVTSSGVIRSAAFPTVVVNSVGAGDVFDAGFIAARLDGQDMAAALRQANAVASLKIRRSGARDLPTRTEVQALLLA